MTRATHLGDDVEVLKESAGRALIRYATHDEWVEHWVDMSDLVYLDDNVQSEPRLVEFARIADDEFESQANKMRRALEAVLEITTEGLK